LGDLGLGDIRLDATNVHSIDGEHDLHGGGRAVLVGGPARYPSPRIDLFEIADGRLARARLRVDVGGEREEHGEQDEAEPRTISHACSLSNRLVTMRRRVDEGSDSWRQISR